MTQPPVNCHQIEEGARHPSGASQFHVFYVAPNGTGAWSCCATCQTPHVSHVHLPFICGLVPLNAWLTSCLFFLLLTFYQSFLASLLSPQTDVFLVVLHGPSVLASHAAASDAASTSPEQICQRLGSYFYLPDLRPCARGAAGYSCAFIPINKKFTLTTCTNEIQGEKKRIPQCSLCPRRRIFTNAGEDTQSKDTQELLKEVKDKLLGLVSSLTLMRIIV